MIEDVIKTIEKQPRAPRNYGSIEKGALALGLSERVELKRVLVASIEKEVVELQEKAKQALEIASK